MYDKSLFSLPFSIIRCSLSTVCHTVMRASQVRVHFVHAVFRKDTCYLKSGHKPVTLSADLLSLGSFVICGVFCTLRPGWSSTVRPVRLYTALQSAKGLRDLHSHQFCPLVSALQTCSRSLCTQIQQIVCPISLIGVCLLIFSALLFASLSLKRRWGAYQIWIHHQYVLVNHIYTWNKYQIWPLSFLHLQCFFLPSNSFM